VVLVRAKIAARKRKIEAILSSSGAAELQRFRIEATNKSRQVYPLLDDAAKKMAQAQDKIFATPTMIRFYGYAILRLLRCSDPPGRFSTFVPMSRRKTDPATKPARMTCAICRFGHTVCSLEMTT